MYWLDTVILCVLAGGAIMGALLGFLWQMFWIIAVSVGLYCSLALNDLATPFVHHYLLTGSSPAAAHWATYALVFILVFVLFLVVTLLLSRLVRLAHLQWLNRLLGSAFVATILASGMGLVFLLLNTIPLSKPVIEQSRIAPILVTGIQSLAASVPQEYRETVQEKVEQTLQEQSKLKPAAAPRLEINSVPPEALADHIIQELTSPRK